MERPTGERCAPDGQAPRRPTRHTEDIAVTARTPDFITFTGVDDLTSIEEMAALSARYPIEWGVLFDPLKQGESPRFPSVAALERVAASGLRLAAHLCGDHIASVRDDRAPATPVPLDAFARVQLNSHKLRTEDAVRFSRTIRKRCILPCSGPQFPRSDNLDWLYDPSGGRGRTVVSWPPHPGRLAGYAGGIGPDNVANVIAAIDAGGAYWIDMETGVRTAEIFDLALCEAVCRAAFGPST